MKRERLETLIKVTQLLKEPIGSSESHDIHGKLGNDVEAFVEGRVKVIRISRGVLAQCELNAEVRLICSRCLAAFLCPISFTAEEEFLSVAGVSGHVRLSSSEESEGFTIGEKGMLDLGELIRQYVLLGLPMKPLCQTDCPGMKEDNPNATTT